jgi:hypothetical protein
MVVPYPLLKPFCMHTTKEIFKEVKGWEGLYQISNCGRVKRIGGYKEYLKPFLSTHGYPTVVLQHLGRKLKISVHRLVALHFLNNPFGHKCVNHIDNDPCNNMVENLEWCTQEMNVRHAVKQKRHSYGEKSSHAKLIGSEVNEIKRLHGLGIKEKDLATRYNVHQCTINRIVNNKNWKLVNP